MTVLQTKRGVYTAYFKGVHAEGYSFTEAIINLLTLILN